MKKLLIASITVAALSASAQVVPAEIPADIANKPFTLWEWNLTNLFIASMVLGRFIQAIRNGGGIKGAILGIWLGTNSPKP